MEELVVFNKSGRILTDSELNKLRASWKRKGLCARCGTIQTHQIKMKGFLLRRIVTVPLNNENVHEGKCKRCESCSSSSSSLTTLDASSSTKRRTSESSSTSNTSASSAAATPTPTTLNLSVQTTTTTTTATIFDWMTAVLDLRMCNSHPDHTTCTTKQQNSFSKNLKNLIGVLSQFPDFSDDDMDTTTTSSSNALQTDPSRLEHFFKQLRPTIVLVFSKDEEGHDRDDDDDPALVVVLWIAVASVMRKLLWIGGPMVAEQFFNQGYHFLFLERLHQPSCDCNESECLLTTLALLISSSTSSTGSSSSISSSTGSSSCAELGSFFLLSYMDTILMVLYKFRDATTTTTTTTTTLTWVLKCCMLNRAWVSDENQQRRNKKNGHATSWQENDPIFELLERVHRERQNCCCTTTTTTTIEQQPWYHDYLFRVECHLLGTLMEQKKEAWTEFAVPCILRNIQAFVDSLEKAYDGDDDDFDDYSSSSSSSSSPNHIMTQSILRLIHICILHGNRTVQQCLSSTICDFAVQLMEKLPRDFASSSAWILWKLSEAATTTTTSELTLLQVQQVLYSFGSVLDNGGPLKNHHPGCGAFLQNTDNFLLAVYSFIDNVLHQHDNIADLDVCHFPLQSLITFACTNTVRNNSNNNNNVRQMEAKALINLLTKFPNAQSTMFETLTRILSETSDDQRIKNGLDILLNIVVTEKESPHVVDIPRQLLDTIMSVATTTSSSLSSCTIHPSVREQASRTLQVMCVVSCCVSMSTLEDFLVSMWSPSSLASSSPLLQQSIQACKIVLALDARRTAVQENEGALLFYKILQALIPFCKGLLENSSRGYNNKNDDSSLSILIFCAQALSSVSKHVQQPITLEDAKSLVSLIYFIVKVILEIDDDNDDDDDKTTSALEYILLAVLNLCAIVKNNNNNSNACLLLKGGVVAAVADAMKQCAGNTAIQEHGSAILALLSASMNRLDEIAILFHSDGVDALLYARHQFPDHATIQHHVRAAFSHLKLVDGVEHDHLLAGC